jgi:TolB-like protein/class 3 adenylate cyclase/Tfp pilus assembly protein PilF
MSAELKSDLQLEIAHLLLIDVVGYSKLLINEQIELMQELNRVVRSTECFRTAEASDKLIRVPTGDGMALIFFRSPEEPMRSALEISQALKSFPNIELRMGIHSGPVNQVRDVNDRLNVAGAGFNVAQRVMDCGDAGHILLSKHVADDLAQYRHWQPHLHDLGECEVKHGQRLHIVNLYKDNLGNPQLPQKLRRGKRWKQTPSQIGPIKASRLPQLGLFAALLLSVAALTVSFWIFFHRAWSTNTRVISDAIGRVSAVVSEKSIAILPFENLSDEKTNAFFADGVQNEILNDLAKVADLKVISRTSVMEFREQSRRNLREIGKQLGVAHVLEGSVQRAGNRVRVSAQLIDARTDMHLWAEHYDRDIADVFAIESELAQQIASQLKAKLSPREKAAIQSSPTRDLAAYEFYIRAKEFMAKSVYTQQKENMFEAARLLSEAVARDPDFFLAYCDLASVHDQIYLSGMDHTPNRLALAEVAVQKALSLGSDSGQTHLALADHLYCAFLDYERASQELDIARRALPNESHVFELAGYIDRRRGRWDESTRNLQHALELDPRNFSILQNLALSYHYLRRYPEEIATHDRALLLLPNDKGARLRLAAVELEWHGDTKPLHAEIQTILAEDPSAATEMADQWVLLALNERDYNAASQAVSAMGAEGTHNAGFAFPRAWSVANIARARGDSAGAAAAFKAARIEVEKAIRDQPGYAQPFSILGLIDAGLGRKEDAIREGRRAVELLPITKDAINGALAIENLAQIYAWTGEKEQACNQLAIATGLHGDLNYGWLRLHPDWDPLRGDPRFEKIVASLAPK